MNTRTSHGHEACEWQVVPFAFSIPRGEVGFYVLDAMVGFKHSINVLAVPRYLMVKEQANVKPLLALRSWWLIPPITTEAPNPCYWCYEGC